MDHAREVVELALDGCLDKGITDWSKIKAAVKDALSDYVWKRTKRSPMILQSLWRHKQRRDERDKRLYRCTSCSCTEQ